MRVFAQTVEPQFTQAPADSATGIPEGGGRRSSSNFRANFDMMRAVVVQAALFFSIVAATVAVTPQSARAAEVRVPLTIDYFALTEAIRHQLYTGPGGRAPVWNGVSTCQYLYATDPMFSHAGEALKFETAASLALGVGVGDHCVGPVEWNGIIESETSPYLALGLQLKFHVQDLNLLNLQHQKTFIVGKGFDLIKGNLIPLFESFTYDLKPAVQQLSSLAEAASTPDVAERVRTAMATIRSDSVVTANEDGVRITLIITVPDIELAAQGTPAPLTPGEIASFEKLLDQWDAFLAFAVKQMGGAVGDPEFRAAIMKILLDSRYRLVDALANPAANQGGGDPVRVLFLDEWNQLHEAIKSAAERGALGGRGLELMSFVSAGDALFALDQAAPALGMRISADDLRRLAHILAPTATGDPLEYNFDEDPTLKHLFSVPEPPSMPGPLEESDIPPSSPEASPPGAASSPPSGGSSPAAALPAAPMTIVPSPIAPMPPAAAPPPPNASSSWLELPLRLLSPDDACAEESGLIATLERAALKLKRVVVSSGNVDSYRTDMTTLLQLSAERELQIDPIDGKYTATYETLVKSAAWQESCWRQFVVVNGRIRWLESSTGDVGLMQVNKRVWRGFYSVPRLEWDVLYNAGAGAEILMRMLSYAIDAGHGGVAPDSAARSAYAAYNAGPRALHRWTKHEPPNLKAIDDSFWAKYQSVKSGDSIDILSCAETWGHMPGH
jgi:Transglycosylase SLT domain